MFSAGTQRDNTIEELKRLDALLEYAVAHGETEEVERIRAELRRLAENCLRKHLPRHKHIRALGAFLHAQVATCDERFEDTLQQFFLHDDRVGLVNLVEQTRGGGEDVLTHLPHSKQTPIRKSGEFRTNLVQTL
jgi:hypothetical protein